VSASESSEIPNIAFTPSNCVAATLNWTISAGEAASKADTTAGDDNIGAPKFEKIWSKSDTPALIDETEPTAAPLTRHIGGKCACF
jgi:hypothetical protein